MEKYRLAALSETYPNSIFIDARLEHEDWIKLGEPHCWLRVDELSGFIAYVDCSYGNIALFEGAELIASGRFSAITERVVALDKDYYGISHYIFVR